MEATLNTPIRTSWRTAALVLALAGIAYTPVSWLVDGITPSYVVYPLVLIVGIWRYRRGGGTLYFGVAATIFLLVHAPFTWAAVSGGSNPANGSAVNHPVEWVVSLLMMPLATALAGFVAWREQTGTPLRALVSSHKRGSALLALGVVAALSLAAAFAGGAAKSQHHRIATRPLQQGLDQLVTAGAPGAVLLVRKDDETVRLTSGYGNLAQKTPIQTDDRFRVGSITKTVVATVVLQLAQERWLRLGDTVERWLPGLVANGEHITIRELLNHTSGLPDYITDPAVFKPYLSGNAGYVWTPDQLLAVAFRHKPLDKPGVRSSYSNTNYILLGLIVEKVASRSLASELENRILRPLHLNHTSLGTSPRLDGDHADGYVRDHRALVPLLMSPTPAWAAAGLVSTADDVAAFYRALLTGRLLSTESLQAMETTVPFSEGEYGLGILKQKTPCGVAWGHVGEFPGYTAIALSSNEGRRQIVALINASQDALVPAAQKRLWQIIGRGYCDQAK